MIEISGFIDNLKIEENKIMLEIQASVYKNKNDKGMRWNFLFINNSEHKNMYIYDYEITEIEKAKEVKEFTNNNIPCYSYSNDDGLYLKWDAINENIFSILDTGIKNKNCIRAFLFFVKNCKEYLKFDEKLKKWLDS